MAKDTCGSEFMRGVLLVLNVIFILIGLTLIGLGIYMKVDTSFVAILNDLAKLEDFAGQSFGYLAFILIGGGIITVLIALFGCVGALWKSGCVLYMYGIILVILMILEIAAFIMAFVYKGQLQSTYEKELSRVFQENLNRNNTGAMKPFHDLENGLKCCGVKNISDYGEHFPSIEYSTWCKANNGSIGCSDAIIRFLNKNLPAIGGVLGGVVFIELLGLIGAIILVRVLRDDPDTYSSAPGPTISRFVGRR